MLYGAYGANLNMANMEVRCPKAQPMISFMLEGYRLVFNSVADIVKDDGKNINTIGSVPIGLWKITKECEKSLDGFEGYPYLYKKIKIDSDIPGAKGKIMLYVMRNKGVALPPAHYFNTIAQGYEDFGLDKDYLNWAVHEADQMQKNKLDVFKKLADNDDLELGVDWEYDWDGSHIPLTDKAKRR